MSKGYQVVGAHDGWVGSRWSARLPYPQAQTGNRGDRRMRQGEHWTRGNCGKKENWSRQYPFRMCRLVRQFLLHKIVFKRCKNRVLIIWILLFTPSWGELAAKTDKLWIKHIKCNIVIACGKKRKSTSGRGVRGNRGIIWYMGGYGRCIAKETSAGITELGEQ